MTCGLIKTGSELRWSTRGISPYLLRSRAVLRPRQCLYQHPREDGKWKRTRETPPQVKTSLVMFLDDASYHDLDQRLNDVLVYKNNGPFDENWIICLVTQNDVNHCRARAVPTFAVLVGFSRDQPRLDSLCFTWYRGSVFLRPGWPGNTNTGETDSSVP